MCMKSRRRWVILVKWQARKDVPHPFDFIPPIFDVAMTIKL
jgi:hypothetical protein